MSQEERDALENLLRDDRRFYAALMFESDNLGPVVRGHAFIEAYVEKLLERNMKVTGVTRWHAIEITRRLEILRSVGEIDAKLASAIQALTEIRNGVAHNPGFSVSEADVEKFAKAMSQVAPEAMRGVNPPAKEHFGLFLQMYGVHGAVLRSGIFFLKWMLQAKLQRATVDPLKMLSDAREFFQRPLPTSMQLDPKSLPFDLEGRRQHKSRGA